MMIIKKKFALSLTIALCVSCQIAFGEEFVDTFPQWNGSNDVWEWGATFDSVPTFGQTFTPSSSQTGLKSIRFAILNGSGGNQDFRAFVYAWTGTTTSGPPVFAGPNPTGIVTMQPGFVNYDVDTGNVAVTPGQQYVAFFYNSGRESEGRRQPLGLFGHEPQTGSGCLPRREFCIQ